MSLLLEALKKAEKSKEEAQKRAHGELELEPASKAGMEKRVLTRPELPDIGQPLEIASEDLNARAPREEPPREAARAAARAVFEAKFREPNPRLPFFITLGLLGAVAVGMIVYLWYELRPPPALVNLNPARTASEQVVAAPASAASPQPAAAAPIPGLPPVPAVSTGLAVPAGRAEPAAAELKEAPAPSPAAAPPRTRAARAAEPAPPQPEPEQPAPLRFTRPQPAVHPGVEAGYAAYVAGDLSGARKDYERALQSDSANRDALLGLAAIEIRSGRYPAAEALYVKLLQSDPRDAHAHAGLIGLRGGLIDPVLAESRIKTLLAAGPAAAVLHFTLGNQLALQGRWPEAQQEYFRAFAAEPGNADFAYNLAVSLDHLRQPRLALEYYRRALSLAEQTSASFDAHAAGERAAQLAP
jgi:tetratricopeptide (TPR) repeat protein